MGTVSITRTTEGVQQGLIKALDLLEGLGKFISKQDRIMLKPNLNGTEGLTNIVLVDSFLRLLFDANVKNVIIAESTFGGANTTDMCFAKSGYVELAEKYSIPLINLNKSQFVEKKVKNFQAIEKIRIAKEVFEVDKIINFPVMKVHYATGITLSLKNLKGLLVGEQKRRFHEIGLDKAIVDLNTAIKAHLNIVDCIQCMERMGPRGGDILDLNFIMAGENAAEVDYVGSKIMGYSLEEVKHLKYYIDKNSINVNAIKVKGEPIESVKHPFKKVQLKDIVPENVCIHDKNACSSCMNALLLSLRFLETPIEDNIDIYLGSKIKKDDIAKGLRIAFGNCCSYNMDFDIRIKGCPPYPFDLKNALGKI